MSPAKLRGLSSKLLPMSRAAPRAARAKAKPWIRGWHVAGEPQPPAGEGEAGQIAEQGRVAELGQVNADMPKGEVGSEKEGRRGNQQRELTPRPVNGLLRHGSNDEQKRQRQRQAPEPGGDWARPRQPDQPRAERQRAAADEHGS